MSMNEDIRWILRLSNYTKALGQLTKAVSLAKSRSLTEIEEQGLIQSFEFTHELSWNVIKDYFLYQGNTDITGSRDAVREAFQKGLIADGSGWMEMIKSRNLTAHTYNEEVVREITGKIIDLYYDLFIAFEKTMKLKAESALHVQ